MARVEERSRVVPDEADVPAATSSAQVLASRRAVTNPEVRSSRPSVSVIDAVFMSAASYKALASVEPRCSAGVSSDGSAVSKNLGEISWRSSDVKSTAAVSFAASAANPAVRVEAWKNASAVRPLAQRRGLTSTRSKIPKATKGAWSF